MDKNECLLTEDEAQLLAIACLTKRSGTPCRIRPYEVLVRGFGWVFSIEATSEDRPMEQGHPPCLVLVNKRSQQVVATSGPHSAVSFAEVYEALLARSVEDARNWCLSGAGLTGIPGIAEEARRAGLEDISVAH